LRLLYRDANVLILDEPTTVLTPQEVEDLFVVLRRLRDQDRTVIFISHKLREVLAIADRVTIMRGGHVVATVESHAVDLGRLAELMVGDARYASLAIDAPVAEEHGAAAGGTASAPLLSVQNVGVRGAAGDVALPNVA